jgi:F-type H+-transporting ATPase subunit epsilon
MASLYNLEIVTPDRKFFEGQTEMCIVRTTEGDIGILYDHEPLVAPVSIGKIRIRKDGEFLSAACAGGFMTVDEDKVVIVTDAAEWAEDIDIDRAKDAYKKAKDMIEGNDKEIDVAYARASLSKAMNRLRVAGHEMDH